MILTSPRMSARLFWGHTLLVLSLATLALSQEYLVLSSQSSCQATTNYTICFTLGQLAQTNLTNGTNLTLIFQPGEHTLIQLFSIHNFTYVKMIGQNTPLLILFNRGWIKLSDIDQMSIEGLTFTGHTTNNKSVLQRLSINNICSVAINACYFSSLFTGLHFADVSAANGIKLRNTNNALIEDVVFEDNIGRTLMISETGGTVSVKNSTFTRNLGWDGGAVYIDSVNAKVTINNSIFIRTVSLGYNGSAIYVASGEVCISHSTLTENGAWDHGCGGIYVSSGSVSIFHSTLTGNSAYMANGGGIYVGSGSVSISHSTLTENTAQSVGGGIFVSSGSVSIFNSILTDNSAQSGCGGGIYVDTGSVSIFNSVLTDNSARFGGGEIFVKQTGSVSISQSILTDNTARYGSGGIHVSQSSNVSISHSTLTDNSAHDHGTGIYVGSGSVSISHSTFTDSSVSNSEFGGGITVYSGSVSISYCILTDNSVYDNAGISVNSGGSVSIAHSMLTDNSAYGSGIYVIGGSVIIINSTFTGNSNRGLHVLGSGSALIIQSTLTDTNIQIMTSSSLEIIDTCIMNNTEMFISQSTLSFLGENTISNNGSIYAFNSQVHFNGPTVMEKNRGTSGGAIEAVQSTVYFNSALIISNNTATNYGGGVFLRESSLFVNSLVTISHNTANEGGAIYAYQSTIEFNNTGHRNMISNNVANNGGGIYATASIIKLSSSHIQVDSNTAEVNGGGFYLQQNSRLYIIKQESEYNWIPELKVSLTVSSNKAVLGGGIYVNDSTSGGGVCNSQANKTDFVGECFIQTIKLYAGRINSNVNFVNTFITHNTVNQSGSAIYGGLLDRCTVNPSAELLDVFRAPNGLEYVKKTMELQVENISSDPLQVKLCDISLSKLNVLVKKGELFQLYVKALDQVGNPVNATIHVSVVTEGGVGRLKEGQVEQRVDRECTELEYNVFSEDSSAQVELYAIGPCNNQGISKLTITVMFLNCTCPLGFHPSQSNIECSCECDPELLATECFPEEETFERDSALWIGGANVIHCNNTGHLVHNCPFDYCVDQPVNISLNSSQQIDRQCAYNRSGVLCGECEGGLGLVLATSKCKECSNFYLLLLIPFAVAGIVLAALILCLNITVANGTIYGLILYANVLAANKAIFLPFPNPNFLTVFISWVNLDLGIETCLYYGMSSQAKVLLQLAFPVYLFLLMFLIIILCKYIDSFAKLLSNRNPVAALCTLLILTYSKLIRMIIAALQFTSLECPDSSVRIVWLYDANVQYYSLNHIPRFIAAAIILTACALFTTLLFFGQWFPRCSKWKVMKWTKNTKYIGFMDAFPNIATGQACCSLH